MAAREPLPEWAEDVLDSLADAAWSALGEVPGDQQVWMSAEKDLAPANTAYDRGRKITAGGRLAAYALRRIAREELDPRPWESALGAVPVAVIASWDWDERTGAGLELRRSFKDSPEKATSSVYPARLVADWLINSGRRPSKGAADELVDVTVRMARHAVGLEPSVLAEAWFATHGPALITRLSGPLERGGGGGERGKVLRYVAQRTWATGIYPEFQSLAEAAGISRHTARAWVAVAAAGVEMPVDERTPAGTRVRGGRGEKAAEGTLTGRQRAIDTAGGHPSLRHEVEFADGSKRWIGNLTIVETTTA